ncbi:hypothetical protein BIV57_08110 [Mangrovactinospora gilvigrisea]|uniref:Uncharacterized protein n=1 Tax=Mangrovactinospora gilvigrisea TaxID=1428644 RepID=A0A1J7BH56_9ACTN|nr:hypothetical protein [Mangrovactinospora gilvigrisea]OIV37990.1 hypothetical protein BIV57_08110 [Mangrovactinospora gilvigrisea]
MTAPPSAQRTASSSRPKKPRVARPSSSARSGPGTGKKTKPRTPRQASWGPASGPVKVKVRRPSLRARVLPHLKVVLVVVFWLVVMVQQSTLITNVQEYFTQVFTALGALLVCGVLAVYLYPPRTARWRTLAWEYLASSVAGAFGYALFGGHAGVIAALAAGALVVVLRCNQLGRRGIRWSVTKYYAWRLRPHRAGTADR